MNAISVTAVRVDDTNGPVSCEVPGCYGMALARVAICGYPAGIVCRKHGLEYKRLWAELTAEEDVPMELEVAA